MASNDNEEKLLQSVALQNARSILAARRRAEEELVRAKEALELRTQELVHSVAMMRATLESTTDGILVTDGAGKVTDFNEKFVKMWQLPGAVMDTREHRQLLETTCRQFNNPQRFLARIEAIYASSPPESYDLLELADGRVLERFSSIQFAAGRNVGRVWSFRDITERRRAETALQKQSEWLRVTLASIGDGVITTDREGRVTSLNPVAEVLTGWAQDDARGQPLEQVFRIVNEESRALAENPAARALREGRVVGLANHTLLIAKDGTERAIDDSAAPIKDGQGIVLGVVLVFRDVTERRGAEEARLHLAAVVESSDDAIVSKSLDGIIRSWNRGAKRVFGYTAAEAVGRSITLVIPPERVHEEDEILARLRRGERVDHFETVRVRKDGRRIDVSVTISPVKDASGTIIGASKVARDITEQKQAEAALRDADRRKDEFLATLAHELRNPLAPIRNALQIMQRSGASREAVQSAQEMMGRQLQHMVRLIDDLLDLSRVSRGRIELRKEQVELGTVLHSAIETSRPLIQAAGHELAVQLPPTRVWLDGDPTRLVQIVGNLLNNAAKYTRAGGHIWLTAEQEAGQAVIRVRDDGIGIPAEMLPRIFEMFTQVHTSIDRSQGGLGIGLTLVKSLVDLHHGTVEARSDGPGKGSEFVVRLPVATESLGIAAAKKGELEARPAPTFARRILVVDDNVDAAQSLGMLLRLTGHDTALAHDGISALEVAQSYRPDVVLLDIGLPRLNGYEVARRIRQQLELRDVVLVAITGWGQEEDRRRGKEAGFDHHLIKPVDPEALENLLASLH